MNVFVETLLSIPKEVSKDDQLLVTFESCRNLLNISQPNPETFGAEFFSATQQELNDTQWDAYCNESYDLYESVQKIKPLRTEDDSTGHRGSDLRYGPQSIEHTARECYSEIPNIEETECKTGDVSENMKDIEEGNTETKTDVDELLTGQMIPHDDPSIIVGNVLADLEKSGTIEDVLEPCSSEKETKSAKDKSSESPPETLAAFMNAQKLNMSKERSIESPRDTLAQLVQHHKGKMIVESEHSRTIVTRSKAEKKQSANLTSPYALRIVSSFARLSKEEKEVYYWAITNKDISEHELVYSDGFVNLTMFDIRTLAPHGWISVNIINAWSSNLNLMEQLKSVQSYSRFFYTCAATYTVVNPRADWDYAKVLGIFSERLDQEAIYIDNMKLKDADLVFFPIYHAKHFYVMCFNFKDKTILLFDNSSTADSMDLKVKYSHVPRTLVSMFKDYLKSKGLDGKVKSLQHCEINRVKMSWRDERNKNDCGVFVMRHMETYFGVPLKSWSIDIGKNPKKQLQYLRAKYCKALLYDELNLHTVQLKKNATKYFREESKKQPIDVDSLLAKR